jgi:hypothetical protein
VATKATAFMNNGVSTAIINWLFLKMGKRQTGRAIYFYMVHKIEVVILSVLLHNLGPIPQSL